MWDGEAVHMWPTHQVIDDVQRAVSWNALLCSSLEEFPMLTQACNSTSCVSSLWCSLLVTMNFSDANQQVTNVVQCIGAFLAFPKGKYFKNRHYASALVGTPEAVCPPTKVKNTKLSEAQKHQRWCQWFAGLIDGDGCFLVNKQGYTSLEITVDAGDEPLLRQIQNVFGGSLKPRSGVKAVRYRMHNIKGMLQVCEAVNGYIRHPARFEQFVAVCQKLGLQAKTPDVLHVDHGWFAGMFDADGSVTLNLCGKFPQMTVKVTQSFKEIPQYYQDCFVFGCMYYDNSQNGYWSWAAQSKADVLAMIEYFKSFPCKSTRRQKLFLVPKTYDLMAQRAHLPATSQFHNSVLHKKWLEMVETWKALSL